MRVKWLRSALRDLDAVFEHISADKPQAAAVAAETIRAAAGRLAEFPQLGRAGRVGSTRELVVGGTPWLLVYQVGDSVEILRVLHGAQRWPPRRQ